MLTEQPLIGLKLLVADDEFLIAADIVETLQEQGAHTVMAVTVTQALECARDPDLSAALLDVRMGRETVEVVADLLASRRVPFMFYTGEALPPAIRAKHADVLLLQKPVHHRTIVEAFRKLTMEVTAKPT